MRYSVEGLLIRPTRVSSVRTPLFRRIAMALCLVVGVNLTSSIAGAQSTMLPPPLPEFVREGAAPTQFARYTPFPCSSVQFRIQSMMSGERMLTWHDRWPPTEATRRGDAVAESIARDSSSATVRRCLATHTVTNTPPNRLWGLGTAWLEINDFAHADTVFKAMVQRAATKPLAERAELLRDLVVAYAADTHAVRRRIAAEYMQQLDALGTPASQFQIAAHNALFDLGQFNDSLPLMIEQAGIALRVGNTMPKEMRKEALLPLVIAIVHQADLDGRRGNFSAAMDSLAKAYQELNSLGPMIVGRIIGTQLGKSMRYGKEIEPIKTNFVYLPGQSNAVPTADLPRDGHVSLIININHHDFRRQHLARYATVFELLEKFGDKIDITLLGETSGNNEGRLIPPAEEAPVFRDFYRTYLKFPTTIAIWTRTPTGTRADGMLIYPPNPNPSGDVILIDKHRRVRNVDSGTPARLIHMIEELLREP